MKKIITTIIISLLVLAAGYVAYKFLRQEESLYVPGQVVETAGETSNIGL